MATFEDEDLRDARFIGANLRGARFVRSDLSEVVLRGVDLGRADLDAPWLLESGEPLWVNGVDVTAFVDVELDRRFPGRSQRRAQTPVQLRSAWAALEAAWASATERVSGMPAGTQDISVDAEWSFAQTLRHVIMAIDTWLRAAIQGDAEPYHPIGQPNVEYYTDGHDPSVFDPGPQPYEDVLAVFGDRMRMMREFLSSVTEPLLLEPRKHPWAPQYTETVLACVGTVLEEGWEHLRYATRDLDVLSAR